MRLPIPTQIGFSLGCLLHLLSLQVMEGNCGFAADVADISLLRPVPISSDIGLAAISFVALASAGESDEGLLLGKRDVIVVASSEEHEAIY